MTRRKMEYLSFKVILVLSLFSCFNPIYAQEGDGPLLAWRYYYSQRAYPLDQIPPGAFENAINQRAALRQSIGYQYPLPDQWQPIGPRPFYWEQNKICSGRIHQVKYDPNDLTGQTIYITGAAGGLWKTTNAGSNVITWADLSGDLPSLNAGAFEFVQQGLNTILYFGSGDYNLKFGEGREMRLFKSTNNGVNWVSISNGLEPGTGISKITISPWNQNVIFVATFHGLYKTTNGGDLWERVIPLSDNDSVCTDVCFSPDGENVYATGPSYNFWAGTQFCGIGYWRSTDRGNTFESVSYESGFPHQQDIRYGKTLCAVSQDDPARLYLLNFDEVSGMVWFYRSNDGGANFEYQSRSGTAIKYHLVISCSDRDADVCFVGYENLYKTEDGGANWECVDGYDFPPYYCPDKTHADFMGFDFDPTDLTSNKITWGNDGGVFRSEDRGETVIQTQMNRYLGSLGLLWRIATDVYDKEFTAAGMHDYGFGYRQSTSQTWVTSANHFRGDGGNMTVSPFKSKKFVGAQIIGADGYNGQPIEYSSNGINFSIATGYLQTTWTSEVSPFAHHPTQPGDVFTVRFDQATNRQIYIYKSSDYGVSWGELRQFQRPSWEDAHIIPTSIAISPSNPNTMIIHFGESSEYWHFNTDGRSRLIKSTDGGLTWEGIDNQPPLPIVTGGSNGTEDRYFTDVEFDPKFNNIVYLTLSGYYHPSSNGGHVFMSTDGGYTWDPSISGNLPDVPVNDIMVHYTGENTKEFVIGTDIGVFRCDASGTNWSEVSTLFPNTYVNNLDYNRLSGILRASTWGRGAWEFQLDRTGELPGPIYVQDKLYITDDVNLNTEIIVTNGGKLILGHSLVPEPFSINFQGNAKITVEDGGEIDASSGIGITLMSYGTWAGIKMNEGAFGTIKKCTTSHTETPITILSTRSGGNDILIENCTFENGSISASGRDNITINNCVIDHTSATETGVGIYAVNCDNLILSANTINECWNYGILVSNSSAVVRNNVIYHTQSTNSAVGIKMNICYSSAINNNQITDYNNGIYLFYSSPTLLENIINLNITSPATDPYPLSAEYFSNPRLKPTNGDEGTIWDAGLNTLKTFEAGTGIYVFDRSMPDVDYGHNNIYGYDYHVGGWYGNEQILFFNARENCWDPVYPPVHNFLNGELIYESNYCEPPGGGAVPGNDPVAQRALQKPPQPVIICYNNNICDTFQVTGVRYPLSADKLLFSEGLDAEIAGNYQQAINKYLLVVQNYQDSSTAIDAMKKILYCKDRLNVDTTAYLQLRSYYQNLAAQNLSDTAFVKVSTEMASKCLVRISQYPDAITEYEGVVLNSTDSLEVLCAELNIIETYLLIQQGGDSPGFTGKIPSLKPASILDAIRMINEKLHRTKPTGTNKQIPLVFKLSQNYPNPFNPLTKIDYAIPKKSNVTLKVYDILGRLVRTLVDEFREAGVYTVQFDGTNLASGVYFYTIEAGEYKASKKMVLVK